MALDDDDRQYRPDSPGSRAEESELTLVRLQISNMDWNEAKEASELHDSQRGNDGDGQVTAANSHDTDRVDNDVSDNHGELTYGYRIATYITKDVEPNALFRAIEPGDGHIAASCERTGANP